MLPINLAASLGFKGSATPLRSHGARGGRNHGLFHLLGFLTLEPVRFLPEKGGV